MNTWPSIHREGALALFPHNVAEGNKALDALIKCAALSISKRETLFASAYVEAHRPYQAGLGAVERPDFKIGRRTAGRGE